MQVVGAIARLLAVFPLGTGHSDSIPRVISDEMIETLREAGVMVAGTDPGSWVLVPYADEIGSSRAQSRARMARSRARAKDRAQTPVVLVGPSEEPVTVALPASKPKRRGINLAGLTAHGAQLRASIDALPKAEQSIARVEACKTATDAELLGLYTSLITGKENDSWIKRNSSQVIDMIRDARIEITAQMGFYDYKGSVEMWVGAFFRRTFFETQVTKQDANRRAAGHSSPAQNYPIKELLHSREIDAFMTDVAKKFKVKGDDE